MIEELCVRNFKSFGPDMEPMTLSPLNFVVGANASGKTNLLSALRFLKTAMLQNVEIAANEYGGAVEIRNKITRERGQPKPLQISLSLAPRQRPVLRTGKGTQYHVDRYHYELNIGRGSQENALLVTKEILTAKVVLKNTGQAAEFIMNRGRNSINITDPTADGVEQTGPFYIVEGDESTLFAANNFISPILTRFRRDVEGWAFFNIDPSTARLASRDAVHPVLGGAGENLATILHRMKSDDPESFSNLVEALRGAIPAFKDVKSGAVDAEGRRAFQIFEQRLRAGINPGAASDGSIRLLALMVIVYWSARKSSLVCIEEPETGLHPHLAKNIIEVLRIASEETQVLATTHNPDFLDQLEADEIILCDKVGGFTQVRHAADVADVADFRKHYSFGELWEQGTLGAVP